MLTLTRRPTAGEVFKHLIDGAAPVLAFLAFYEWQGPAAGAVAAVVVAVLLGILRRVRGDSLVVVTGATLVVAVHGLTALLAGEGRAFFLPELVFNAVMALVFGLTLVVRRPVTAIVCSAVGLESPRCWEERERRIRHDRLTLLWLALWIGHTLLLGWLYLLDSVVGLGLASLVLNKPTLLALVVVTVVVVRRPLLEEVAQG